MMHMAEIFHIFGGHVHCVAWLRKCAVLSLDTQTVDTLVTELRNAEQPVGSIEVLLRPLLGQGYVRRSWALAAFRLALYERWRPDMERAALAAEAARIAPVSEARIVVPASVTSFARPEEEAFSVGAAVVSHDLLDLRVIVDDTMLTSEMAAARAAPPSGEARPYLRFEGEPGTDFPEAFLGGYARNYYHWLIEVMPILRTYIDGGFTMPLLSLGPEPTRFQAEFFELFGLSGRVRPAITRPCHISVGALTVTRHLFSAPVASAAIVDWLRERIAASPQARSLPAGPEKIYVTRSDTRIQRLRDEERVSEMLAARGFTTVSPGRHGFLEQARLFSNAREIVGVHGAGLANTVFCPPGALVVELNNMQESHGDHFYRDLSRVAGHRHVTLRPARETDDDPAFHQRDTPRWFDIDILAKTLDAG